VTVVIAAHDEADQIDACVRSVSWAAEVLVVENDSTDDTIARARTAGATVFSHPFRSIGAQRNAAIARARHPWVFVLDADERATPALGAEVARLLQGTAVDAYRVRRRNWFLGREIRHSGWDRDRPVRLFRSTLRYDERPVHGHVLTSAEPGVLRRTAAPSSVRDARRVLRQAGALQPGLGHPEPFPWTPGLDAHAGGAPAGSLPVDLLLAGRLARWRARNRHFAAGRGERRREVRASLGPAARAAHRNGGFMAAVKPRFRHWVQYAAGRGILALLRAVSFDAARKIGRSLGGLGYSPFGVRRNVVERQIAAAFPDASTTAVGALVREAYGHFGEVLIETALLPRLGRQGILLSKGPRDSSRFRKRTTQGKASS
jgi:hypothetical protein